MAMITDPSMGSKLPAIKRITPSIWSHFFQLNLLSILLYFGFQKIINGYKKINDTYQQLTKANR